MAAKDKIPLLYLKIYDDITKKFKYSVVEPEYLFEMMNIRVFRIPKPLFFCIINEMIGYGLVQRINHKSIAILPNKQLKRLYQLSSCTLWDKSS